MSIERALIAQAQPFMIESRAKSLVREEEEKGCQAEISINPLSLEPDFQPLWERRDNLRLGNGRSWTIEDPPLIQDLVRLQIWISPEQGFDWNRSELLLKQLQTTSFRLGFEVAGNNKGITIAFLCHRSDLPVLTAAFKGEFQFCELTTIDENLISGFFGKQWESALFQDYFPYPPYSHLLTRPAELRISPLTPLIAVLSCIEEPAVGFYQALFQAVRPEHNWNRNVQILLDLEYSIKLMGAYNVPQRYAQQSPSGDLHQMASELENKAHNDKNFFGMALRVAVVGGGTNGRDLLDSVSTFLNLFQHGGRPLQYLTEEVYQSVLSPEQIRDMFLVGLTYRPGFLVNSLELTGPVHVPHLGVRDDRCLVAILETLPVRNSGLDTGTWIGTYSYTGKRRKICIPPEIRARSTHIIGRSGVGKSTELESMILDDIGRGEGVAVLDPHGDLVERILCLIPETCVDRTVYLNPADPEWVPLWNPMKPVPGQDLGLASDDSVLSIKSIVSGGGWGDRLEHLLRITIFSLMHLPNTTLLDLWDLLRNNSKESEILRREILNVVTNESVRQFWLHDFAKYGKDDLGPPRNKLSKLLVARTSLMLSQPENRFNFRRIMDDGMILLVNLSKIGSRGEILGCFLTSLLHRSAISRSDLPADKRKPFHIYCDEVQKFMTDSLEQMIVEIRKYEVTLTGAHQFFSQLDQKKIDAFSSVGSTIIFNVDRRDAQYLTKDLRGMVDVDDLISLEMGRAIARIGTEIVRIETCPPLPLLNPNFRDQIIEESRRKYYKPAHEVERWIRHRGERWSKPFTPLVPVPSEFSGMVKEFSYDEF